MSYTIIKHFSRGTRYKNACLTIVKSWMSFPSLFQKKYEVGNYIRYMLNDDGFLCFAFFDKKEADCYKVVTRNGLRLAFLSEKLKEFHGLKNGVYEVTGRDGDIFITNCKSENSKE